jgi:hypothetical protein
VAELLQEQPTPPVDQTPPKEETPKDPPEETPKADAKPPAESALTEKDPEDKSKEAKPEGAPEKYEPFKVAEGYTLVPEVAEKAQGLFKEMNLPQAQAQKLVDFYVEQMQSVEDKTFEEFDTLRAGWRNEIKADPKFPEMKANIGKALTAFEAADPKEGPKVVAAFREAMNFTGAGDHPAFVRALAWMSTFVVEGGHVSGEKPSPQGQGSTGPKTGPQALYPDLPSSANAG